MIGSMFPDSFAGGVAWTVLAYFTCRFLLELARCGRGWRR